MDSPVFGDALELLEGTVLEPAIARERLEQARIASSETRAAATILRDVLRRPSAELAMGADGKWFALPSGARVSVARRPAIRRILVALADQHRRDPHRGLSTDELTATGWPTERPLRTSGAMRAYNAIATLRRAGLQDALACRTR